MDAIRQDVRYAIRALLNRPWFSALAVLTLAIGIGVNTVAYSALNALLGKPMRFAGARELGWIQTDGGKSPYKHTALPDYLDVVRENRTFEAVIAEARIPLSMQTEGGAEQVWSLLVSGNYLTALRARPLVGRMLEASGRKVLVGGNIGVPVSAQVDASTKETVHVIEASSFQLEATDTFRPWIALWLNFAADHLDRHPTVGAYAAAKARIFANQRPGDFAVVNADWESSRSVVVAVPAETCALVTR